MMVADSNLIAYLLIPGDKSALADAIFARDPDWAVPLLCRSEIRNILTSYMRHNGMTLNQAVATMDQAERLWREHEYSVPSTEVLALTSKHRITAYDAEYVVLAQELGIPLLTFDEAVKKMFPTIAVDPAHYLKQ